MKRQTLPWMLSMFLVASAGSFGCDDGDSPPGKTDAGTGGTGGKADGSAGAGGTAQGGAGGGTGGAGGAQGGAGGTAAGGKDGGPDTAAGGADGGPDATTDTAVDGPKDTASDMAAPIDMAADMTTTTPDGGGATVAITQCSEIVCPEYFAITGACDAHELNSCTIQASGGVKNVCNGTAGGVVKRKVSSVDNLEAHTTTVEVFKADGSPCYTLTQFTDQTVDNIEHWTFKKPDGTTFATGGYTDSAVAPVNKFYLSCGNVRYNVMDGRFCAGFEGDTSSGTCTAGTCAIP
jgi:hypothetical protein